MTKTYEIPDGKTIIADVDEKHHTATVSVYALDDLVEAVNKTGHWIEHEKGFWSWVNKNGERDGWIPDYECSECRSRAWKRKTNYCPQCGARMFEPQESEDKG